MAEVYAGHLLRVDLTRGQVSAEQLDAATLRRYIGGNGIGGRYLYEEVPPGVEWSDPENRLILATGPLAGTRMGGSGTFSVITKGCLTNGATATQANGYLGAFLRFNGLVGLVFQGQSDHWVYLHVHDGVAELKNAGHLVGKDTIETEEAIKAELGESKRSASVYAIGPAGENLVKFAGIIGDEGHAAAHNGCGAVMGAKKLKAVAVSRGRGSVPVKEKEKVSALSTQIHEAIMNHSVLRAQYKWGTSMAFASQIAAGTLPIKNLNTSLFPGFEPFMGANYRKVFEITPKPCWACRMHHLYTMKVKDGPYAGLVAEEPEYECWAAWGPLTGQADPGAAVMLSDVTDRIGMDVNEAGWLVSFVIDCYERGILTRKDTDGLEMVWGNAEAARALLYKTARREGFGNILAEGVKRASEHIGGEAVSRAVYIRKGHAPRQHDHRARWTEILDNATSNMGSIESGPPLSISPELGLAPFTDQFSPDQVPYIVAKHKPTRQFIDCLGICAFTAGPSLNTLIEIVNAATGWDLTLEEAINTATRNVNLFRVFNIRHGVGPEVEAPSTLYSSIPVDGPAQGRDVKPHWAHMLDVYYRYMGWDRKTGKPLPETLRSLGLGDKVKDIW